MVESEAACMSDSILCNNLTYHNHIYKEANDRAFCWQMKACQLPGKKPIDVESRLWNKTKGAICGDIMKTRAGNAKDTICTPTSHVVGYDNMQSHRSMAEYLMVPCQVNTFRNHLACDDEKCCSIRHQMFMNHTKRI